MGGPGSGRWPAEKSQTVSRAKAQKSLIVSRYLDAIDPDDEAQRTKRQRLLDAGYRCAIKMAERDAKSGPSIAGVIAFLEYDLGKPAQIVNMEVTQTKEQDIDEALEALEFLRADEDAKHGSIQ